MGFVVYAVFLATWREETTKTVHTKEQRSFAGAGRVEGRR